MQKDQQQPEAETNQDNKPVIPESPAQTQTQAGAGPEDNEAISNNDNIQHGNETETLQEQERQKTGKPAEFISTVSNQQLSEKDDKDGKGSKKKKIPVNRSTRTINILGKDIVIDEKKNINSFTNDGDEQEYFLKVFEVRNQAGLSTSLNQMIRQAIQFAVNFHPGFKFGNKLRDTDEAVNFKNTFD
jgi:hypothetical protein